MGRKSALTEKQWSDIERRMLDGASVRGLATEYGIAESAIRKKLSARTKDVKTVANQLATAEVAFSKLPISAQISARSMTDRLKGMMMSLTSAGESAAGVAQYATHLANVTIQKVDESDPFSETSVQAIKGANALMAMANVAAEIPMGLIRAAKDIIISDDSKPASGADGIPATPEYQLVTDEPLPDAPIL